MGRAALTESDHEPEQHGARPELAPSPAPRHRLIEQAAHTEASKMAPKASRRLLLSGRPEERNHLVLGAAGDAGRDVAEPLRAADTCRGQEGGQADRLGAIPSQVTRSRPVSRRGRSTPPASEETNGVVTLWRKAFLPPVT